MAVANPIILSVFFFASIALAQSIVDSAELENEAARMKRVPCGLICRFRWCRTSENFSIAPSGRIINIRRGELVTNPFVCLPDGSMAGVIRTGPVKIQSADGTTVTPIADLTSPSFIPKFFTTGTIPGLLVGGAQRSGLKLSPATDEQFAALNGMCVILPIRRYQTYNPSTEMVTGRSRIRTRDSDCVSFRALSPHMQVLLFWESSDDLDLSVEEPDGNKLDRFRQTTPTGGFTNDNGAGACEPPRVHNEAVIYGRKRGPPQTGTYTITVRMRRNCDRSTRTKYTVRVYEEGVPVFSRDLFTNKRRGTIFTTTYTR